jgi:cytochrome c5
MKSNLFLLSVLLLVMYACGVKSAQKTERAAPALSAAAQKGKNLYQDACGKCHLAYEPKSRTVERWNQVLEPMIKDKAKLSEADGKLVSAYVWESLGVQGK